MLRHVADISFGGSSFLYLLFPLFLLSGLAQGETEGQDQLNPARQNVILSQ